MPASPVRAVLLLAALLGASLAGGTARADASLSPALRGLSPSNLRIVGGTPANPTDWPWQLFLHVPKTEKGVVGYCGASLIAPRWALTAAHCFANGYDASQPVKVFEGLSYRDDNGRQSFRALHLVAKPLVHPGYRTSDQQNDIALLHLDEDAEAAAIEPLAAADRAVETAPAYAIATGWGVLTRIDQRSDGTMIDPKTRQPLNPRNLKLPHSLMKVELPLVDLAECRELNKEAGPVTDRNICAGVASGGKDTCKGDSGGPLVARKAGGGFVQIGVISWGEGCGEVDHPGVYTRVSAFRDWIAAATGREAAPPPAPAPAPAPTPQAPPAPSASLAPEYDNPAGLDVKLVAINNNSPQPLDAAAVKVGQQIAVVVSTRKPGYLVILDETPDGRLTQIFPTGASRRSAPGRSDKANLLAPGRPMTVPDPRNPYAGFVYVVDGTLGEGMISVLESDAPISAVDVGSEGPRTFGSAEEGRGYLGRLSRELSSRFLPRAGSGEAPRYSAVYLPYSVRE